MTNDIRRRCLFNRTFAFFIQSRAPENGVKARRKCMCYYINCWRLTKTHYRPILHRLATVHNAADRHTYRQTRDRAIRTGRLCYSINGLKLSKNHDYGVCFLCDYRLIQLHFAAERKQLVTSYLVWLFSTSVWMYVPNFF